MLYYNAWVVVDGLVYVFYLAMSVSSDILSSSHTVRSTTYQGSNCHSVGGVLTTPSP